MLPVTCYVLMDKIKIVFILGTLDIGGTERQFLEIVRRLNRNCFELRVLAFVCHGKLRTEIEAAHIPFTCLGFSGLKRKFHPGSYVQLYRIIRDIIRYLKQERPHIVQSYLFWANIYGSIAAKIFGAPVIITGRRATMEEKYKNFLGQFVQNLSNLCATVIVANSHVVKQECLQRDKYVTNEKIHVIYNGIVPERYISKVDAATKKREFQIPHDFLVVGIVGSLIPRKGHQDFLKAAAIVLQNFPHTVFLIIGRDEGMRPTLEMLTEELGIRDSIIFTGERDDIPEMLSILDIQVSSSVVEGLSNAILEGMAAGKSIIATDIAGNPELVIHGQTGLLVPAGNPQRLADAMLQLLCDKTLRDQMGKAGQQRVSKLCQMEYMIHQTETLYQRLVDENQ